MDKFVGIVYGFVKVCFLGYFFVAYFGFVLINYIGVQICIDGYLFIGYCIQCKLCIDFGNVIGVFGDDYEIDDYQDCKDYQFYGVIIVDNYFIKGLNYFFCCIFFFVIV